MQTTVSTNVLLSQKTFYGLGGSADIFVESDNLSAIAQHWSEAWGEQNPVLILGKGSNIACNDKGFRGTVFQPKNETFEVIHKTDTQLVVMAGSGLGWQKFVEATNKLGFKDLCPLSGIPGNVGGFIRGNAGAYGAETGNFITSVTGINEMGQTETFTQSRNNFVYRGSFFKQNPQYLIWEAVFTLNQKTEPETALAQSKDLLKVRWGKYPAGRSGGCVFKNPDQENGVFAGQILDALGAKGDTYGGIMVAQEHANFFRNTGHGTQNDLIQLIQKWQQQVKKEKRILLEPEILLIDEFGQKLQY